MLRIEYVVVGWSGAETVRLMRPDVTAALLTKQNLLQLGWRVSLRRRVSR